MTTDQRDLLALLAVELAGRGRINAADAIRAALDEIDRQAAEVQEWRDLFGDVKARIDECPGAQPAVMMPPYVRPEFYIDPDEE